MGHGEGVWLECCFPNGPVSSSTGSLVRTLTGYKYYPEGVAFSPDGQWIVSAGIYEILYWQLSNGMHGAGVYRMCLRRALATYTSLSAPPCCR